MIRLMKLAYFFVFLTLALTLTLALPALAGPSTGAEVMTLVREKNNSKSQVSEISMQLVDRKGRTQDRKLMVFAEQVGQTENSMTRFLQPRRIRGISFLVANSDQGETSASYLYTPADKKVRRVPEGDKKKSFQGTDFTYYDLSPHDVHNEVYQPLESGEHGGHDCWLVTSVPKGADPVYGKVKQWVRKDIYLPIKVEFYDPDLKLLKISSAEDIQQVDGYWTPMKTTMHNVQIDHKTVMKVDRVTYNQNLPAKLFSKSSLEKGI